MIVKPNYAQLLSRHSHRHQRHHL